MKTAVNSLESLSPGQHQALALMALQHKDKWRDHLKHLWWTGKDDNVTVYTQTHDGTRGYQIGAYLRQVRNQHGAASFLDSLHLADIAQVFEVYTFNAVGGSSFRFNGWFEPGEVYDSTDIAMLNVMPVGDTLKPSGTGESLIIRRL